MKADGYLLHGKKDCHVAGFKPRTKA